MRSCIVKYSVDGVDYEEVVSGNSKREIRDRVMEMRNHIEGRGGYFQKGTIFGAVFSGKNNKSSGLFRRPVFMAA